jgi:hypothetical protein
MKYILITLFTLIINSCQTNWGKYGGYSMDYDSKLDYYIILDKVDTIIKNYPYKNEGAFIRYCNNKGVVENHFVSDGAVVINSYVDDDDVYFDNIHIILKQKPLEKICECNDSCLSKKYSNPQKLKTYNMCQEALNNSDFYQYWIIDKTNDIIYGPLTKEEFNKRRNSIGISKNLDFE